MQIKFFTNAAMEITAGRGVRILCDPWFTPGAFDGSWWHWPPLSTRPEDLTEYTYLYISHIHQDHCDVRSMRRLPNKNVPVIILKKGDDRFLRKRIESCGFLNFIELADRESAWLPGGVRVTMYEAFSKSVFVENAEVPNIIDSSIVVKDQDGVIFNANDNIPTPAICEAIVKCHGEIGVALLPYGGVGPFPSSYGNLMRGEKLREAEAKKKKYLERLIENAHSLKAKYVVPCAGQMILGGRHVSKNETLGMSEPEEAHFALLKKGFSSVLLKEGDTLSYPSGYVGRWPSRLPRPDRESYLAYLEGKSYWWEEAFRVKPEDFIELTPLLQTARNRMGRYQEKFGFFSPWRVGIALDERPEDLWFFDLTLPETKVIKGITKEFLAGENILLVRVPYNYLIAILTRHCHWNNAYHGCQVEWFRKPDNYIPDIQTLLAYFHL